MKGVLHYENVNIFKEIGLDCVDSIHPTYQTLVFGFDEVIEQVIK